VFALSIEIEYEDSRPRYEPVVALVACTVLVSGDDESSERLAEAVLTGLTGVPPEHV